MLFPMSPDILHRIKFRSISRQELDFYSAIRFLNEIPNQTTAMAAEAVPDNKKIAGNLTHQVCQELHHLGTSDRSGKKPEVKRPPSNARNRRNRFPVEVELKHWSLSSRGPRPAPVRPFAQTTFVDENYGLALQLGFFLSSGHRFCFHRRIASSSRSKALVVGLWQLHPSFVSSFHTCPEWYLIPHSRSIKSATLQAVQRPVSYPSASGPRFKPSRILSRSASVKRGFRPARPAFFKPDMPNSLSCRAQRLTDWRCTPTRRATSASWIPCFNSLAACMRRCSSTSKFLFTPAGFPMHWSIQQNLNNVTILCGTQ